MKTYGFMPNGQPFVIYTPRRAGEHAVHGMVWVAGIEYNSLWLFNDVGTAFRFAQNNKRLRVVNGPYVERFIKSFYDIANLSFHDCRYQKQISSGVENKL